MIELLVALSLGLLLTAIMGTMYLSSKATFKTSTQVARTQENLRFSSYFIERDLRESSFTKCGNSTPMNNQLNSSDSSYFVEATKDGIMGWEYDQTSDDDTLDLTYTNLNINSTRAEINTAKAANTALASKWQNNASNDLPTLLEDFSPLRGSDIILISAEEETNAILSATGSITDDSLQITSGTSTIEQGHILKVGNCSQMDKFQNVSKTNDTGIISTGQGAIGQFLPGNKSSYTDGKPWGAAHQANTPVFTEVVTAFYISTGAGGVPSLFRYSSRCGLSSIVDTGCGENVELTEGVENMQIFYGEDTDNDFVANIYRSADDVSDFSDVVSIRVSLLMRSLQETELADTNDYTLADVVTVNPDDLRVIRYVSNSTIHLRNRGL